MSCAVGADVVEEEDKRDMATNSGERGGDANTRLSGGILFLLYVIYLNKMRVRKKKS